MGRGLEESHVGGSLPLWSVPSSWNVDVFTNLEVFQIL